MNDKAPGSCSSLPSGQAGAWRKMAGCVVTERLHSFHEKWTAGPHPLVGEAEDEPKPGENGSDKAKGRNGEEGQPLIAHDAEGERTRP